MILSAGCTDTGRTPAGRGRGAARTLWVLFSLYVLYGTVLPFDLDLSGRWVAHKPRTIGWIPFYDQEEGGLASRPDLLANTVLFLPFGFLGFWATRRPGGGRRAGWAAVCGLAVALSVSVELLQLFTRQRYTSTTDVILNTLGAAIGFGAGSLTARSAESFFARPSVVELLRARAAYPVLAAALGVAALTWNPFVFSLDASALFPKLRALSGRAIEPNGTLSGGLLPFFLYSLLGFATATLLREIQAPRAALKAAATCLALAVALEPTRLAVHGQLPSLAELAEKAAGCVVGAAIVLVAGGARRSPLWFVLVLLATAAVVGAAGLRSHGHSAAPAAFQWTPFRAYYDQSTVDAVADVTTKALQYLPLGFVAGWLFSRDRRAWLLAGLFAAFISLAVEIAQRYIPGRSPDISDVIVAITAALAGVAIARGRGAWSRVLTLGEDSPPTGS